ncbi:hypothetical protein G6011_05409 [Alternaria panax]|uniref:Uncharacterized protein n=1 Tax=Alternaria panax TaxID=48097 RepID=A0AAD4FCX2_9PLEO|nr:hypothetical protein G6011_05409 [Alternaria panax]
MNTAKALHEGWDAGATVGRDGDDAYTHVSSSSSSSFTAINQPWTQFSAPQSPIAAPIQQNQARRRATVHGPRRHNPAVAQYLGLGTASEPTHLEIYASLPATPASPPREPTRKRTKLAALAAQGNTSDGRHTNEEGRGVSNQRRVSESFRVTKPAHKSAASTSKAPPSRTTQSAFIDNVLLQRSTAGGGGSTVTDHVPTTQAYDVTNHRFASPETITNISQDTVATLPVQHPVNARLFDLEADDYDTTEAGHTDLSFTPQQHETLNSVEDDFDFDMNDYELLTLTSEACGTCSNLAQHTSRSLAQSYSTDDGRLHPTSGSCADIPIMLEEVTTKTSSQVLKKQFTSPVTLTTRLQAAYGNPGSAKIRKPIVRPSFPESVRDRSPVIGLSSNSLLRTCFRIGEVVNQSCQASKSGKHIMIEMYARILTSERIGTEQQFTFCDLFHAKPPYIKGSYSAAIWESVELFEYDGRRLLQQGRLCRCIGTMKREEKVWAMTVLNIWEATWEDIEWVEGIG